MRAGGRDSAVRGTIEGANLDTVLGLSLTSTAAGWVLVEGHGADGAILDHDEFALRVGGGAGTVQAAEQVAAAVSRAEAAATATDHRLHLIRITWSDDAAAGAALVVETLTAAGFDNVVSVRLVQAAETLAQGLAPVIGYDKTAVCVLEHESATVVMVDSDHGETRTAVKQVAGGADGLSRWLTKVPGRNGWHPDCVVVVGSDADLEGVASELDDALSIPVFTQSGAELALARGAALASAQDAGFTEGVAVESADGADRFRSPSYAGAMTALVAAAVTLVGSVSLAVGLRLAPAHDKELRPSEHLVRAAAAPRVAVAPVVAPAPVAAPPATASPPPQSAPEPSAVESPEPLAEQPAAQTPGVLPEQPPAAPPPPAPEAPPPDPHPLLTRILQHIRGEPEDPPPAQPPDEQPPSP